MKTALHTTAIIALLSLASTLPVLAMDDGGGRSVFAHGAGERALALGGASAALADGPAVMVWNPAGIAALDRTSFYASSTNLIGLGFNERMGAVALPNWRLGTFGLAFRRFSVDGIEERDDRATLGNPDLSDAENEIIFGFGRTVGRAWRLGLAAKYQQQTLAGYSDGALGLDVGVSVQPLRALGLESSLAHNLSLGLAARNFLEPSLRLADESVPDPTGIRLGAAFGTDPDRKAALLLVADMDKTRDMDSHFHAGIELTLLHTLSLRCGSNAGMLTAGAGLRVDDFAFDYAFEDNIIAGVHRFGLSMAFGRTTGEKRQAALRAEEAAFQKRLAAMFARQEASRVERIYDQVRLALDRGDYLEAQSSIATLRVLDPDGAGLDHLEASAYLLQARKKRDQGDFTAAVVAYQQVTSLDPDLEEARNELRNVRERNDREAARSQELRQLLDQALAHYAAGELIQARDGFQAIIDLNPDDRDAKAFLASAIKSLNLKCETLADRAMARATAGDTAGARQALVEARRLAPDNEHLALQTRRVEQILNQKRPAAPARATTAQEPVPAMDEVPATAIPSYAKLPFKRQAEVVRLYREGVRALEEQRRQDAIRYWELVYNSAPDYPQVAQNLKQEYLVQGMEAFAGGSLDQAIAIWEKALKIDPADARTRGYLARAYDHQARIRQLRAGKK